MRATGECTRRGSPSFRDHDPTDRPRLRADVRIDRATVRAAMPTKYAIVIPDGAADEPQESLGGKTPLQAARTPEMDRIAREGVLGRSRNVPDRFLPASDVATLSLFGYDPVAYYTGRAPLEAAAMGHRARARRLGGPLQPDDDPRRAPERLHRRPHHERGRARADARRSRPRSGAPASSSIPGVSYRNLMIVRGRAGRSAPFGDDTLTTPPHDSPISPRPTTCPEGTGCGAAPRADARPGPTVVRDHPVNQARLAAGKSPANAIWLWGQGKAPALPKFAELHGLKGAILSAVDLVRGVGVLAGWDRIDVPGATGYLDTDYAAKGRYGIEALKDHDLVCVHVEAPDEASHEGRADAKVEALERIDRDIVGPAPARTWKHTETGGSSSRPTTRPCCGPGPTTAPWVPWAMAGTGLGRLGPPL